MEKTIYSVEIIYCFLPELNAMLGVEPSKEKNIFAPIVAHDKCAVSTEICLSNIIINKQLVH